jgi:hypothetical protein
VIASPRAAKRATLVPLNGFIEETAFAGRAILTFVGARKIVERFSLTRSMGCDRIAFVPFAGLALVSVS